MDIQIRKATTCDAPLLALLAQVSFRQAFDHFWNDELVLQKYFKATFSVDKLASSLQKPNNVYWLAFADQLPVGYAKLKIFSPYEKLTDSKPAQLQKIYLIKGFYGLGIGEQMQEVLFQDVSRRLIQTLWLAVWNKNIKAIRFYERHGFSKTTTYHYVYENMSIDYLVMTKKFNLI